MSFLDSLGGMVGKMAAQMQEANSYKGEYEQMSNQDLKREYDKLSKAANEFFQSEEVKYRLMAVKAVMNERRANG